MSDKFDKYIDRVESISIIGLGMCGVLAGSIIGASAFEIGDFSGAGIGVCTTLFSVFCTGILLFITRYEKSDSDE